MKTQIHKGILFMIFMILAVTHVTAQDTFVLFEEASHVYTVTKTDGNSYNWSVFEISDLNNEILDTDLVEFLSGKDAYQTEIKWKQAGDYVLVIEEIGSCQNLKANRVSVINTPTIAFKNLTSDDCADDVHTFATQIVAEIKAGSALADTQYPLTVNYEVTYNGETKPYSVDVEYENQLLNIDGITEDISNDKIYSIKIIGATTIFGGKINLGTKITHTRTLYALPTMSPISIK